MSFINHSQSLLNVRIGVVILSFMMFNFQYDAKLLKLQRNCAKTQGAGQTSNANNDIFRKVS